MIGVILSSIIFFSSLLPSHNLAELSQLSNINSHFQLHQITNQEEDLTFWQFFWQHYSPFVTSHDQDHSHDLPLFNNASVVDFTYQSIAIEWDNPHLLQTNTLSSGFFNNYRFLFVQTLIHPPKN